MTTVNVTLSWECDPPPLELGGFNVYATPEDKGGVKGTLVATAKAEDRTVTFEMEEGAYIFRVLAFGAGGAERAWEEDDGRKTVTITGRSTTAPSAPATAAVLPVEPSVSAAVVVDPPPSGEAPTVVQVIEGPDEFTGKLVGEVRVESQGGRGEGARLPSARIPLEGSGRSGTRSLLLASRSEGGTRGAAATPASVIVPERFQHEGILIAEIDTVGLTKTGFATPGATDLYEYSGANGMYARRLPASNSAAAIAAGTVASASWWTTQRGAPYVQRFVVESDEKDLGASLAAFVLECYDEVQRSSATGAVTGGFGAPVQSLNGYRAIPGSSDAAKDANTDGPAWFARNIRSDGKPRRPVRNVRWEYVVGTSSPVAHADADYKPYVPGAWLAGRYVRVRLVVEEPTGFHLLKTGAVSVYARVPRLTRSGTGTPESAVAAPPLSTYLDRSLYAPYVKDSGQGNTGWVSPNPAVQVEAFTADHTLTPLEREKVCTNTGAAGTVILTLPPAAAGLRFVFIVNATQVLRIQCAAGDTLRINASISAATGKAESSTKGCSVTLVAVDATEWIAQAQVGSWTVT